MIAFAHSVFALPFALVATWVAASGRPAATQVAWIVVAMVAARTFAMTANRVVDRELDARNPRTAARELVTGDVSTTTAWLGIVISLTVFGLAVSRLAPIVWPLAPIALALLALYPYVKRWSWTCHFALGLAQAAGPIGAWLAVSGRWSWSAVVLGLSVGTWMAGFDLIYATQDVESDRANRVHSIPADFSVAVALVLARASHVATVLLWAWFALLADRGPLWIVAVVGGAALLAYEPSLVRTDDLSRVDRAFFTVNGWVALAMGALGIADAIVTR